MVIGSGFNRRIFTICTCKNNKFGVCTEYTARIQTFCAPLKQIPQKLTSRVHVPNPTSILENTTIRLLLL